MALTILNQIITMLLIMAIGVLCYKVKIITKKGMKELSDLLLMVVNPIVIFISYQRSYEPRLLKNLFISMALSFLTYAIMILCSGFLFPKKRENYGIERFASIYSNCGFFGIPLVGTVLGLEGVFYLTAYITAFNLLVWTNGICLIKGGEIKRKELCKSVLNPNIIAVILGFALFILNISLPEQIFSGIKFVGDMNTPLAMIVAGITLAQSDLGRIFMQKSIYYVGFVRLLLFPIVTMSILQIFPVPEIIRNVILIAVSCPVGATITLFTIKFDKNTEYAASLYAVTTILAAITMPLIIMLSEFIG